MSDSAEKLAGEAIAAIERLTRELLSRRSCAHLIENEMDPLVLELGLSLRGGDSTEQAARLKRRIDELLDEAVQHAAAFRPGHAYCHRCSSAECEHSAPPSSRHVFTGYAPTGAPRWGDFAQRCLDLRHPEVDRLYNQPPALLTLVQTPEELHSAFLSAFDNRKYALLGQVTAGYFSVPTHAHEGRGVIALSIQAALSRTDHGRPRVGLNLIARGPGGESLDLVWERQDELPWRRSVRWAQAAVASLGPTLRRMRPRDSRQVELERRVAGILGGLRRRLERDNRSRSRRTRHAEERHRSGERPTRKAIEDVRDAADDAFLSDDRSGVLVVLGDRGRTHFFGPGGKLVSSVRYSRDAIARKVKQERWRPASREQRETLRRTFADD
jgi:hypothetical protein